MQRVTTEFLQWATSATSNEQILQRVTGDVLQWATSPKSNQGILQRATSNFTTSNERRVNLTSNEQQVKSYASKDKV